MSLMDWQMSFKLPMLQKGHYLPLHSMIFIDGVPTPYSIKKNKWGGLYNPRKPLLSQIKWQIRMQYRQRPYDQPVVCGYYFGFPIPKKWPKEKRELAFQGKMLHDARPDIDNLIKFYNDAIKKIVIEDDKLISECLFAEKRYDPKPQTVIWVFYAEN